MFFITKFKSRCVIFQVGLSFSFYLLLMDEFLYQLIGTLSHYYRVLYIRGGAGFRPSTV